MNKIERLSRQLSSDLLRTFITVADNGNVTHAADVLHKTQSAVSVQIKNLEELLGSRLFIRQARGVSLTAAGEMLLSSARDILKLLDKTAQMFCDAPLQGYVRVGIPDDYSSDLLASILAGFSASYPGVEVMIRSGFSTSFPKAVNKGELDIAVYSSDRPGEFSIDKVLREEQTVWVCNDRFVLRSDEPVPLALFNRACWWREAATLSLESIQRPYRIAFSSESVAGVKAAITAGLAVGVLARSTVEPSMRILGKKESLPALPASNLILIEKDDINSPAVKAMSEVIREYFR